MDDRELWALFQPLWSDIKPEDEFYSKQPLLAHYTTLDVLENILKTNEIWFSNPLFMNDLEEVKFGVVHGLNVIKENHEIREAFESEARHKTFTEALDHYITDFERKHLLDTYVFCMSEHDRDNWDGLLSMWRGYGGDGKGAALVFDTSKINAVPHSPLIIARVHYGSSEQRYTWFRNVALAVAKIVAENKIPDEKIYVASYSVFERLKIFALFSKHHGFREEKEWRAVYLNDRDTDGKLKPMQHYFNGPRGVEPKLRLKIAPIEGLTASDLSLDKILDTILLGPSTSSPLAVLSVERMLDIIGKPELKERLIASTIPLRPT